MPYGQTVTLVRRIPAGTDDYGNDTYTEVTENIPLCSVQPDVSTETIQFTDVVTSGITVFLPYGTDVTYLDAVIPADGIKYEIQGDPSHWVSPFSGHAAPIQVRATKVKGVSV